MLAKEVPHLFLILGVFFFPFKQVDYLQQANHDLEKQLKDTIDQHVDATKRANEVEARNAELLLELKDIGRMSKRVEEDKERNAAVMRSELEETKVLKMYTCIKLWFC